MRHLSEFCIVAIGGTALFVLARNSVLGQPQPAPPPLVAAKIGDLVRVEFESTTTRDGPKVRDPATVQYTVVPNYAYGTLVSAGAEYVNIASGSYRWDDGRTYDTRFITIPRKNVRAVVTLKLDQTVTLPAPVAPTSVEGAKP